MSEHARDLPVVILCGGLGTRLKEETEFKPKPMVSIGDRPIIWHIMKHYARYGRRRFVLCLGYKGDVLRDYFLNYEAYTHDFTVHLGPERRVEIEQRPGEEDWSVTLAETGLETTSAGRIVRVRRYIDGGTFFLTYGDGLSTVDLDALLAFHRQHGKLATVTGVRPLSRFGDLTVDGPLVTAFAEKAQLPTGWINGGFFVMEPGALAYMDPAAMLEGPPLEALAREGQLAVYQHEGFWRCMDTYRDVQQLNELWRSGAAPWRTWGQ